MKRDCSRLARRWLLPQVLTGIATCAATIAGAVIGYEIIAHEMSEADRQRRATAKVDAITCEDADVWNSACSQCHGKHSGGKVCAEQKHFRFGIRTASPITVTGLTVGIYRVQFQRYSYNLYPKDDPRNITRRPGKTSAPPPRTFQQQAACAYQETAQALPSRPEFTEHRIMLENLRDDKATLISKKVGRVDIVKTRDFALSFELAEDYGTQVSRIGYQSVQVLASVTFHTEDGLDIPSDPFLITLPAMTEKPG